MSPLSSSLAFALLSAGVVHAQDITSSTSPIATATASVLSSCAAELDGQLPSPTPAQWDYSGNVRRYYIAAEEVEWDYAPTGWDNWLGVPMKNSPRANMAGVNTFGTKWLKALYRGYTDETFTEQTEQPPWQGTQGPTIRSEVGDLIEIMFLNNLSSNYATMHSMGLTYTQPDNGATYPNSTAPGEEAQLSEGAAVPPAIYAGVEPGGCVVYKWMVEEDSGPDEGLPSKTHSYHSYVALQQDTNAGLIGPQIVYGRGMMEQTMAEYREFTLLYMIYEESDSWLSAQNGERLNAGGNGGSGQQQGPPQGQQGGPPQKRQWQPRDSWGPGAAGKGRQSWGAQGKGHGGHGGYGGEGQQGGQGSSASSAAPSATSGTASNASPASGEMPQGGAFMAMPGSIDTENVYSANESVWRPQVINLAGSNQFGGQAPSFFSMNGYIFANNPLFDICFDDKVIWYVNAYGSMSHVFHMHGNNFQYGGARTTTYAISVNDGEGKTLFMNATGAGLWQVICHVNFHQTLGMLANYRVQFPGSCSLPVLEPSPGNPS